MKYLIGLSLILFFSFSRAQTQDLIIALGSETTVPLNSSRIWIQHKDILTAEAETSRLRLIGKKEGSTSLKVGSAFYRVDVVHPKNLNSLPALKNSVSKMIGLSLRIDQGKVVVEGTLYRFDDWLTLVQTSKTARTQFQSRFQTADTIKERIQHHLNQTLSSAKLPPLAIIFDPAFEVRVKASSLILKKYREVLDPLGIEVTEDETSLSIAPTIKVEITVAEVKKDAGLNYGLRWPANYSAQILPDGTRENSVLPFNVTALEARGVAKILASPNILTRSGEQAEFLAGGEFPIKIMNYKVQDIVWKRYGILLRVKPQADAAGRMSISIETEVSTVDDSRKVDDIPGLLTHRVSSHFDLTKPQTIALSGLIKNEESQTSAGLPYLSRIPVLGALFSSKDFKENRTELVIFVRPSIVDPSQSFSPKHLGQL